MTKKTDKIQSDDKPWQFKKGQSGNPAGKPKGARNKTTLALQALLDGEGEEITRKAIEVAKEGDMAAIRLIMDRVLPARKDSPVSFKLAPVASASDASKAIGAILSAVAAGKVTPSEANETSKLITSYIDALRTTELEQRIQQLEERKP